MSYLNDLSLMEAARSGDLSRVEAELAGGANIESLDYKACTPLTFAASEGHVEIVRLLVKRGASRTLVTDGGFSLLHWAVFPNSREILELIWDKPMEIDLRDVDGRTPLTWSVSLCSDKATHWLLTKGADPNALDRDGWTPLHYAACWNNAAVVLDLIHAGARDGMRSQAGETAQEVAIRSGFERVVSALRQARSS